MKIVLVALYNYHSYAIRQLHAILEQHGYPVSSVFFKNSIYTSGPPSEQEISGLISFIARRSPDLVAFSVHSPLFQVFKKIANEIRLEIGCEIAVGGEHPTACPESFIPYADYIVQGEGEDAILKLAEGVLPAGINKMPCSLKNLDELPVYYYGAGASTFGIMKPSPWMSYLTGRGCPYSCSYCQESVRKKVGGNMVRRKSVLKVIDDIKYLKSIFAFQNPKQMVFSDSVFTINEAWLEEFCCDFARLEMKFQCYGFATNWDADVFLMLKDAGMNSIRFGVQSGSKYLRSEIFNRKDNLGDILSAAWFLHKNGISAIYDFIVNNPYDSPETLRKTRNFIRKLPQSAIINCFELRWFPGTPLTKMALEDCFIEEEDVEGNFDRFGRWDYTWVRNYS